MIKPSHRAGAGACLTLGLILLLGCPALEQELIEVHGTVLDEAGNAVRPTRVSISAEGKPEAECVAGFGWFSCPSPPDAPYTLTLERGGEVYTDTASPQDGCDDLCMTFRPFIVETAPDGGCSPDTLPLVARLVSSEPGTLGAVEGVGINGPAGVEQTVLPAFALGRKTWVGTPDTYVQDIFAEPGVPSTEPMSMIAYVRANGRWCHQVGGWSGGMRLDGEAVVAFLPKPGSTPCSYDPVEIHVDPRDIVNCYNISD